MQENSSSLKKSMSLVRSPSLDISRYQRPPETRRSTVVSWSPQIEDIQKMKEDRKRKKRRNFVLEKLNATYSKEESTASQTERKHRLKSDVRKIRERVESLYMRPNSVSNENIDDQEQLKELSMSLSESALDSAIAFALRHDRKDQESDTDEDFEIGFDNPHETEENNLRDDTFVQPAMPVGDLYPNLKQEEIRRSVHYLSISDKTADPTPSAFLKEQLAMKNGQVLFCFCFF